MTEHLVCAENQTKLVLERNPEVHRVSYGGGNMQKKKININMDRKDELNERAQRVSLFYGGVIIVMKTSLSLSIWSLWLLILL